MGDKSKIEWTEASWNPVVGCSKVSKGCRHCYAIRAANRMNGNIESYRGLTMVKNGKPEWTGTVRFIEERLTQPLMWKRPRMIFVNSMSDLFHESVSDAQIENIFAVMCLAKKHTFQVLTKRHERMQSFLSDHLIASSIRCKIEEGLGRKIDRFDDVWPAKNVWLGVSVEDQKTADERIPILLKTPAAIRWISAEPLLAEVNNCYVHPDYNTGLHWVVAGGESGIHARPSHPDWFRYLRDQCLEANVPFFFKQWGEWGTTEQFVVYEDSKLIKLTPDGKTSPRKVIDYVLFPWAKQNVMIRVGKKKAGRLLDGHEWNQYPEATQL